MKNQAIRNAKNYLGVLKTLFPLITIREGRFLRDMRVELMEYCKRHPDVTYEEINEEFGYPEDVLKEYIASQDGNYLLKTLKKKHTWKISLTIVITATFICVICFLTVIYKSYSDSKNAVLDKFDVNIGVGGNEEIDVKTVD